MPKYIYSFAQGQAEGSGSMKALLGGKGAGLQEMCSLGIPVPPGFTLTTEVCAHYAAQRAYPDGLARELEGALLGLERAVGSGARFGDPDNPLLLSVRSGARVSMPGMMDTVLNLGLNDATVAGLARRSGNRRFAFDSYRRFVQMFGDVVMGLKPEGPHEQDPFETLLNEHKLARGIEEDEGLGAEDLEELVGLFKKEILRRTGRPFPDDPMVQLWEAIAAVLRSWDNPRAVTYRRLYDIPAGDGTAVNVQAMVFGNLGEECATGVAFTRDPASGERRFFGEFLRNAQGEDVVAGIRTPLPLEELSRIMPAAYGELVEIAGRLERHFRDMQDIEFTIQNGKLWMLQTRTGKRSGRAMVKIAVDLVAEGLIDRRAAILRMDPGKLDEILHPTIDPEAPRQVIGKGLPASPGAATGRVVFDAAEAEAEARKGERVILVRIETSPEDIHGMKAAEGILTARGGMTSHAAVVARGMGKSCVAGASGLAIDYARRLFTLGGVTVRQGETITLDGKSGEIMLGEVAMTAAHIEMDEDYRRMFSWIDEARRLKVRANADTPLDARTARRFGAEGVGLCRTEHMFFAPERILAVRQMILSTTSEGRREALGKILPMQREDFMAIFTEMDGLPVTVRLLDPPLHEFLPTTEEEMEQVGLAMGLSAQRVRRQCEVLHEQNPMLGHRGSRLGITCPEIYEVQVRAILEAALLAAERGTRVYPEIMLPLIGHEAELLRLRALVERVGAEVLKGTPLPFTIGTMIELPRACLVADRIAAHADFFSFGTNDLTQTTLGLSRDDAGRFLQHYLDAGIYRTDPFVTIDAEGVGALMEMAISKGRAARPALKLGICGEHGGDPRSVELCHGLGLDYVSCSPFRVPIARLAAAQAALR